LTCKQQQHSTIWFPTICKPPRWFKF